MINNDPQFPPKDIRQQFPLLERSGEGLVYLDTAATSHKPREVLKELGRFYGHLNSNIHRGLYPLSEKATEAFEGARSQIARFLNARFSREVIFTKGTTEAVNMVALSWGETHIESGDEIVVTVLEHHSNLVPWQQLAGRKGATLKTVRPDEKGFIDVENLRSLLSERTKLVALAHISNAAGTILPVKQLTRAAQAAGARVLVDAAQSVAHLSIDVQDLGADWLVFSGHKMYGPTGVGVLYGREEVLQATEPCFFGGGMIREVTLSKSRWSESPYKFEAGTPPLAEAAALARATELIERWGREKIALWEEELTEYALQELFALGVRVWGPPVNIKRGPVVSFTLPGAHPHDVAHLAGERGVCLRAGHHCAEPLHWEWGITASCRISFGVYNQSADVDRLIEVLKEVKKTLRV